MKYQDLAQFSLPTGFRGRPAWFVQLWWIVQATLFGMSPQFLYGWRRMLLRAFGAQIGTSVLIRPSARVTYPWKLFIGDNSWVGDRAELYNLAPISIGSNSVISQDAYLCTGSHDHGEVDFPIYGQPITISDECWIASASFISPGVTVHRAAVVGARSLVLGDVGEEEIVAGSPARLIAKRECRNSSR